MLIKRILSANTKRTCSSFHYLFDKKDRERISNCLMFKQSLEHLSTKVVLAQNSGIRDHATRTGQTRAHGLHQVAINLPCRLTPLVDGVHDERLASMTVAGTEYAVRLRGIRIMIKRNVASRILGQIELIEQTQLRSNESHGQ